MRILKQDALNQLVYLVGPPRGGTTIMYFCLGLHDKILTFPMLSSFIAHVWRYKGKVHDRLLRLIFRERSWYRERQILNALGSPPKELLSAYVEQVWREKELKSLYGLYPLIYSLDDRNKKNPGQLKCWADKANDIHCLDELRVAFPAAKFIIMTRDPRAMVSSAMQRSGGAPGGLSRRNAAPILNAAIYWRNMMQVGLRFAQRNAEVTRIVRYEDFVQMPDRIMNELFDFCIGERMPKKTLKMRLATLNYWATNKPSETGTGIHNTPVDRWRTLLAPDEVNAIAAVTRPTARKLGYDMAGQGSISALTRSLRLAGRSRAGLMILPKQQFLGAREPFVPDPARGIVIGRE